MSTSKDSLSAFELKSVCWLDRDVSIGSGAFGRVRKVSINGVIHAAKKLHDILINSEISPTERSAVIVKFRHECLILSRMKHPNIVHFVGIHKGKGPADMSLIMECLDTDLAKFVENHHNIPVSVTLSILLDVSYGLVYLHTHHPPIIHRDLSAHNILLTKDLHAKIADLGMSKLFSTRKRMTMAPGHLTYMAPECLFDRPEYDEQIDIFSFGHLALSVLIGRDPGTDKKREAAMKEINHKHCLRSVVSQCLKLDPNERPIAEIVNKKLKDLCMKHPKTVEDLAQVLMEDNEKLRSENGRLMRMVDDLERLAAEKRDEANQLREELKCYGAGISEPQDMISDHSHEMSSSDRHSSSDGISYSDIAQELCRYKQETRIYKEELNEIKANLTAVSQELEVARKQLEEASIREDTIIERSEAAIESLDQQNQILRDQVQELHKLAQHQEKLHSPTQLAPVPAPRTTKSSAKILPSQPFNPQSSHPLLPPGPIPRPRTKKIGSDERGDSQSSLLSTASQLLSRPEDFSSKKESDCTYCNVKYHKELEEALGKDFHHLCFSCNDLHPINAPCMQKNSIKSSMPPTVVDTYH